jgi:peptidoglycan/xylan/chitin deacetylase (PgdA/CDA1 family)
MDVESKGMVACDSGDNRSARGARSRSRRTSLRAIALMYHDVVSPQASDSSGFPGGAPARYKIDPSLFERHLDAIAATGKEPRNAVSLRLSSGMHGERPLFLTFDDGGASAIQIAEALSRRRWPGHFFISSDFIGKPGFVDEAEIAELSRLGHVIGTHTCSHPVPISRLPVERTLEEWQRSVSVLSEITRGAIATGSVPGGYCSAQVAKAAAACGIEVLFTSKPVRTVRELDGCLLVGRYAILTGTTAGTAAGLARGDPMPGLRQWASWEVRGVAKAVLGDAYRALRSRFLGGA